MAVQAVRRYQSLPMVTTPGVITDREQTRAVQHQDNILGRAYAVINKLMRDTKEINLGSKKKSLTP